MSHGHPFETDLREMIARGQVVAVVGSGVSTATTAQAPSWRGLIQSRVDHCRTRGVQDEWCQWVCGQLQLASYPDMLLSAAELVHQKLREHGGELGCWLRGAFAELQPEDPTLIQRLLELNIPLVTTNYDDLIEKTTQLKYVAGFQVFRRAHVGGFGAATFQVQGHRGLQSMSQIRTAGAVGHRGTGKVQLGLFAILHATGELLPTADRLDLVQQERHSLLVPQSRMQTVILLHNPMQLFGRQSGKPFVFEVEIQQLLTRRFSR
jgi:hypothetical protein